MTQTFRKVVCLASLSLFASGSAMAQTYFAGTVVDGSNQPLAGASVQAGHVTFPISGQFVLDGEATSDAQGHYAISTLGAGDGSGNYVLIAQAAGRITTMYPAKPCFNGCPGAFPPTVAVPNLGVDFQLFRPSSIAGHVSRTDTNASVTGAGVRYAGDNGFAGVVLSNDAGDFTIINLLPGNYTMSAATTADDGLVEQVYAGHDFDFTLQAPSADAVLLSEGEDLAGIDFPLHVGATIDGTISSAVNGDPLQTWVGVRRLTPVSSGAGFISAVYSDGHAGPAWGHYRISGLMPGTFHLQFGTGAFATQFYPDAPTEAQAQDVAVSGTQTTAGIDAHLTPLQTIAGTVRDASTNLPLPGVVVHAGLVFGITLADSVDARTDASGHYLLQGLGPTPQNQAPIYLWTAGAATYVDTFYPNVFATECCIFAPQGAQALQLGNGQQLTGYDFALGRGANASGRIYDPDTGYVPQGFLRVGTADTSGNELAETAADSNGHYAMDAVPVGSYYMYVDLPSFRVYYPDYTCTTNCQPTSAQLVNLIAPQNYQIDFAVSHLDLVFRGTFE